MTKALRRSLRVLVPAALLFSGCAPSAPTASPDPALNAVVKTSLPAVGGRQRNLAEFKGQIVLLHFFSSWCAQCGLEAPTLRNVHNAFKDSKFSVVGIAVDDEPYQMQAFVSKYQLPFPVLMDEAGNLKTFFGVKELPTTLFLDRRGVPISFRDPESGEETAKISGPRMWDTAKPVEMIAGLVENM